MKQHNLCILTVLVSLVVLPLAGKAQVQGKKVLYINSYHPGYSWSDGIQKAIMEVLTPAGVEVRTLLLDTYRQKSPEHLAAVSAEAKKTIDEWKPNVVLLSDDPAIKGVYATFYKGQELPFVFCGVNWNASAYGVPAKNITGMVEVCPVKELLAEMQKLQPGKTIGYLASEGLTPQKDGEMSAQLLGVKFESILAKDLAAWKKGFQDLQAKVDLLILGVNAGIGDWNEAEAVKFVEQNAQKVSGSWHDYLNGLSLVAFNKLPAEQGTWAAETVLKILKGTPVGSIPVTSNKAGELVFNVKIAKQVKVTPSVEVLQSARLIQ
jgi:ABC-type uncharacterized transport system substrate-binding protein